MKKSDLRSGDIIETRKDGLDNLGLLVEFKGELVALFEKSYLKSSSFEDNLTHTKNSVL